MQFQYSKAKVTMIEDIDERLAKIKELTQNA